MNKRGKRRLRGEGSQLISRPFSKRLSQLLLIPTLLISIFSLLLSSAGEGKPVKPLGKPIEVEQEVGEEDVDEGEAIIHIIKEGETLESIAENYKIAPEILVQTNGIKLTEELRGGQKLVIAQPQQLGEYSGTDEGEITYYIVAEAIVCGR